MKSGIDGHALILRPSLAWGLALDQPPAQLVKARKLFIRKRLIVSTRFTVSLIDGAAFLIESALDGDLGFAEILLAIEYSDCR
jgi:hypothetical protein